MNRLKEYMGRINVIPYRLHILIARFPPMVSWVIFFYQLIPIFTLRQGRP